MTGGPAAPIDGATDRGSWGIGTDGTAPNSDGRGFASDEPARDEEDPGRADWASRSTTEATIGGMLDALVGCRGDSDRRLLVRGAPGACTAAEAACDDIGRAGPGATWAWEEAGRARTGATGTPFGTGPESKSLS
jgi:hypothetical protein